MRRDLLQLKGQKRYIDANLAEYGEAVNDLTFISDRLACNAEQNREEALSLLKTNISFLSKEAKLVYGQLSPGCRICGQGSWSCLFINGKCNCRCFYCPTAQDAKGVPTTNRVSFNRAIDYADYVGRFDFKGVSISGGEPLLTLDRTLTYIQAVRKKMGESHHIWLYTNGTLLTRDHAVRLRKAGLDEIRFDISAAQYDLSKLSLAKGVIPIITVEIPAIPEDRMRLSDLIPQMAEAGASYLNLHQLRLTPFNFHNLKTRPYTFLHGPKVMVLESEQMALSLLQEATHKRWPLSVNYCSFVYKNRFQGAATRARNARFIVKEHETITENGYIRASSIYGPPDKIATVAEKLRRLEIDVKRFFLTNQGRQLFFHDSLWREVKDDAFSLAVSYGEAFLMPSISYRHTFKEIPVNAEKKIIVEKRVVMPEKRLTGEERSLFEMHIFQKETDTITVSCLRYAHEAFPFEWIESGLLNYF